MNTSRDRDRSIARLLQQSPGTPDRGVTDACLDAEAIAALTEGGLSGAALERAQAHLADCARCQAVVGALVRVGAIAPAPAPQTAPRRWLPWLVPAAAAATAIALWVAVPRGPSPQDAGDALSQQVGDARSQQPVGDALQGVPRTAPDQPPAPTSQGRPDGRPLLERESRQQPEVGNALQAVPQAAPDQARRDRAQESELRKEAPRVELDQLKQQAGNAQPSAGVADKADAPAAGPIAPPTARAAAPAAPPPARFEAQQRAPAMSTQLRDAAGTVIISPDPDVRWRVAGTLLERSVDGGRQWSGVTTGVTTELTSGSAPSAAICWVVGRGGVVLRTTDGQNFSRVRFPAATDLVTIRATDARTASVTTSDGRTFMTTDGGTEWTIPSP